MKPGIIAIILAGCGLFAGLGPAVAQDKGEPSPTWTAFADCAAGYLANWKDRLSSPTRTREMSDMIHAQAGDYRNAAAELYQTQQKSNEDAADKAVEAYIQVNLARFVAMDKAGKLETFIDECPQIDTAGQD